MPDPLKQTVSASQAPALFNLSPYCTRWMLWQHFRNGMSIDPQTDERMDWGTLLQDDILQATAMQYRLRVEENIADEYVRRGQLGATIDGRMFAPDKGKIIIEAKNVDWLRWRDTWTDTAAAPHVEIQLQTQLYADEAEHGIISALVGGNDQKFYERIADRELHQRMVEEAALFFESIEKNREPDPLGSPIELPTLAALYPTADPLEVVDAHGDEEMALVARQYAWAAEQEAFAGKLRQQMKAKILQRAGTAGELRVDGARVYIARSPIAALVCKPHDGPRELRKASVQTRLKAKIIDAAVEEMFG